MRPLFLAGCLALAALPVGAVEPEAIVVREGGIPASLTGASGDAARGRALVVDRRKGLCLLCHSGPFPDVPFQGDLAPSLAGVGTRFDTAALRLRLVDSARITPDSLMPAYYRRAGLARVAPAYAGATLLSAADIEDVVAFLATLRD